jgi:hypothetical protein
MISVVAPERDPEISPATQDFGARSTARRGWPAFARHDMGEGRVPRSRGTIAIVSSHQNSCRSVQYSPPDSTIAAGSVRTQASARLLTVLH